MTREEVGQAIMSLPNKNILAELPTSFGKSKIALDLMNSRVHCTPHTHILIVIPRLVLINNWEKEFKKWGYENWLSCVQFVTYISFPKVVCNEVWDMIIFDEAHHLSARCREAYSIVGCQREVAENILLLSATVGRDRKKELQYMLRDLYVYKIPAKQAIQEGVLPDPKVYLIPLTLDNTTASCTIIKNKSQKVELTIPFYQRYNYAKVKNRKIIITCTPKQYYDDMSSLIAWYKNKMHIEVFKNMFLRRSGERLKWLSDQKLNYVRELLCYLNDQRTLTFCNGIPQTEALGRYCVNSKNKKSEENLEKFNEGAVNHITACNMLDEGMNLVNCRVGVYAVLNSSERMIKQKLGRLLRHPDPIIIIPYYKGTRDEELVGKMLEDYNPELVKTISSLTELEL